MYYELKRKTEFHYILLRDDIPVWSLNFPLSFRVSSGFRAYSFDGGVLEVKTKGVFMWRRSYLFENGELVATLKGKKCISPDNGVWLDSRRFIYHKQQYLCSLNAGQRVLDQEYTVLSWEMLESEFEKIIIALAVLSVRESYGSYIGPLLLSH